jgi:hypothetical protein
LLEHKRILAAVIAMSLVGAGFALGQPLVVSQVNPGALTTHKGIVANPNCSTMQLAPLLKGNLKQGFNFWYRDCEEACS